MDFSGKHIVVTGGASGFGRGIASAFLKYGGEVTVIDRNEAMLEETLQRIDRIDPGLSSFDMASWFSDMEKDFATLSNEASGKGLTTVEVKEKFRTIYDNYVEPDYRDSSDGK